MKVGLLREHLVAALAAGLHRPEPEVVALTADRTKAMGVALAGRADDDDVDVEGLEVSTLRAAAILGFHPEHVRRLIRGGRLRAHRVGGDFQIRVNDLWPLLDIRHREPGRRRLRARR
jgi:excisionase family DNA binding protein